MEVTPAQALSWRLDRQFLRAGAGSVVEVVGRLSAVPAWLGDADHAIRRRLSKPAPDAVFRALADGELVHTYSFRGSRQFMTAADAGDYLVVRSVNRQWELPSWQTHYELLPGDWPALLEAVREILGDGPISRGVFVDRVTARPRFRHLYDGLTNRSDILIKPIAWQGELCFGPVRDGEPTLRSPATNPHWPGLPDVDAAGRRAVLAYLSGYGPATRTNVHHWLVAGLSAGRRRVDRWLAELVDDGVVVELDVGGQPSLHLREHRESLAATEPATDLVILLPGHDDWVLGPGTDDRLVVPQARRPLVTRGTNLVLLAGVVRGTWTVRDETLAILWFDEIPHTAVDAEVERLSTLLQRELDVTAGVA